MDLKSKYFLVYIIFYRILTIGSIVSITSVYLASSIKNPTAFFIVYAVGFGMGKGFMYPAALYVSWSHLPGRKGFVSGVVVSGMGIGSFIFGLVTYSIINSENAKPSPIEVEEGVFENYFP
jgi:OFA family oxalate/formate antiporter-like MFS transporter